jgi:putative endonuclease
MNKRKIGAEYEQLACERLESEGMQILETNYRVRIGEIDIIARDKDVLVFVEVKYRKDTSCGGASYAISYTKQQKIRRVAEWYMNEKHISPNAYCRFDAVLIDNGDINHVKNAW